MFLNLLIWFHLNFIAAQYVFLEGNDMNKNYISYNFLKTIVVLLRNLYENIEHFWPVSL